MAQQPLYEDWRSIAEQAGKEMDSAKLMILIEKLCCSLDGERREKSRLTANSTRMDPEPSPGN